MPQAEANVVSQNLLVSTSRKEIGLVQQVWPRFRGWAAPCKGLGPGPTGAWGPGPSGLGVFRHSEKSPGGGLAKGWESAETAAADVGAWREAGTGYPPHPPRSADPKP